MVIKQIDKNTRLVKNNWCLSALFFPVYKLQIKNKRFYNTVSWLYVSVVKGNRITQARLIDWLYWDAQTETKD